MIKRLFIDLFNCKVQPRPDSAVTGRTLPVKKTADLVRQAYLAGGETVLGQNSFGQRPRIAGQARDLEQGGGRKAQTKISPNRRTVRRTTRRVPGR